MQKYITIFIWMFLGIFNCTILLGNCKDELNLDSYLQKHGFYLYPVHSPINEGYMSDPQKDQFNERLKTYGKITKILEIGLNGGHSAENFFNNCEDLILFVSFDINHYPYTNCAIEYFTKKFGSKFLFNPGDSMVTVPRFKENHPDYKFDLIFIDGCHAYKWAMSDIMHTRTMAHANTILWIDDVPPNLSGPIGKAVTECVEKGIIEIFEIHHSVHPTQHGRSWLEARFIL